jgi:2-methylcitrate dehydratase PrpD
LRSTNLMGVKAMSRTALPESRIPVTRLLTERVLVSRTAPVNARLLIKQCVLDWIGVTLAGAHDRLTQMLLNELLSQGGQPQATIIGFSSKMPTHHAALLNGTASQALDYDDVNFAIPGHCSAPILPAVLALAEIRSSTGAEFMDAFLAGYETACRIGLLVAPGHYAHGFHATATIGSFGAAAACARLVRLDARRTAHAFGIAATQAAGLKSMFGTSCKPLQGGKAAMNGLIAVTLAERGFDSREDVLECQQGFAATHSPDFNPEAALRDPPAGFHILANLFKFHAANYETHAAIECGHRLRKAHAIDASSVQKVVVRVNSECDKICNIAAPRTGLEAKFSLRVTVALALAGVETARPDVYSDASAVAPELVSLRDKVQVDLTPDLPLTVSEMSVELADGRRFETRHDSGVPMSDVVAQGSRLETKFHNLVAPILGEKRSKHLASIIKDLEELPSITELTACCVANATE